MQIWGGRVFVPRNAIMCNQSLLSNRHLTIQVIYLQRKGCEIKSVLLNGILVFFFSI